VSRNSDGNQNTCASHRIFESQYRHASQHVSENHDTFARLGVSRKRLETPKTSASQLNRKARESPGLRRMREHMRRLKHPRLRILVETFYDIQKLRIPATQRLKMYRLLGVLPLSQETILQEVVDSLKRLEKKTLLKLIEEELEGVSVWRWLRTLKGIGSAMAGGLVGWFDDPAKAPHPSSWWKYAGLHVENGKAPRREHGKRLSWNPRLRTHLWRVVMSMIGRKKGKNEFYWEWYERYRQEEIEKCKRRGIKIVPSSKLPTKNGKKYEPSGVISVGHVNARARRKVAKLFTSHLWRVWREMEGLPVHEPYAAKLGHRVIPPPNWPLEEVES